MYSSNLLTILTGIAFAQANPLLKRDGPVMGVATFNDFATQFAQSGTVCGIAKPANQAYFGAAASDISSPGFSTGSCDGTFEGDQSHAGYDMSQWQVPYPNTFAAPSQHTRFLANIHHSDPTDPTKPISTYQGPSCPKSQCPDQNPTCYKVENLGPIQPVGQTPALLGSTTVLGSVTVQIIDACPAGSAWNYCKSHAQPPIDARQRCASFGTNELDIDQLAYRQLTGEGWSMGSSPNLDVQITKVQC